MDWIAELIPFLIALIFLLLSRGSKKKQPGQRQPLASSPSASPNTPAEGFTSFESLVQQIRVAAEQAQQQAVEQQRAAEAARAQPVPQRRRVEKQGRRRQAERFTPLQRPQGHLIHDPSHLARPLGLDEEFHAIAAESIEAPVQEPVRPEGAFEFHEVGAFTHRQHGFGPDNPLAEPLFTTGVVPEHGLRSHQAHTAADPHGLTQGANAYSAGPSIREQLQRPEALRAAFIAKEVLGSPRSRRRLGP